MAKHLHVDIWSDIVCPWCAIGNRRFERALAQFPHRESVDVTWRAFELDPSAPRVREGDHASHLARKYGRSKPQAEEMIRHVTDVAAAEGLEFRLLSARAGNTFDGHRILAFAADRGLQGAVKERLFEGYMKEGEPIGEPEALLRLAAQAGLDADEVQAVLSSDRYADQVHEEEAAAHTMGITGVPFFVLGGKLGVSGAQPAELLVRALDQAWASCPDARDPSEASDGAACGPDGCA